MASEWFYAQNDKKYGPLTSRQLKELANVGVLHPDDLVWSAAYPDWKPARLFVGLLPKTDNSPSPSMSVFWKLDGGDVVNEAKLQALRLEPNSPETANTPPLPAKKKAAAAAPIAATATATAPEPPARTRPASDSPRSGPRTATHQAPAAKRPSAPSAPAPAPKTAPRPKVAPAATAARPAGRPGSFPSKAKPGKGLGLTLTIAGTFLSVIALCSYLIITKL
jgi:hypothetical protein